MFPPERSSSAALATARYRLVTGTGTERLIWLYIATAARGQVISFTGLPHSLASILFRYHGDSAVTYRCTVILTETAKWTPQFTGRAITPGISSKVRTDRSDMRAGD